MNPAQQKSIETCKQLYRIQRVKNVQEACFILGCSFSQVSSIYPDPLATITIHDIPKLASAALNQNTILDVDSQVLESFTEDWKSYKKYPRKSSKETCVLRQGQKNCARKIYYHIVEKGFTGFLLPVETGLGKTFVYAKVIRDLIDSGWVAANTISPIPTMVITRAPIVETTTRALVKYFGLDPVTECIVINIDAMRSTWGLERFLNIETIIKGGEEVEVITWRKYMKPALVVVDECHSLKNENSSQSRVLQALNDVEPPVVQLHSSATPFSRISGAKCFCVSTRKKVRGIGFGEVTLTNATWDKYAKEIATGGDPKKYTAASMERLLKDFHPYIVNFRATPDYPVHNGLEYVDFVSPESKERYLTAWEKYLEITMKVKQQNLSGAFKLAELNMFKMVSEEEKYSIFGDKAIKALDEGKYPLIAMEYKSSIAKSIKYLIEKGISRDHISIIWGGESMLNPKNKRSMKEIHDILREAISGVEIPERIINQIHKQLRLDACGLGDLPEEYNLGAQDKYERQRNIDSFQDGRTHICFFIFAAGGAGLNLHHETVESKPRRTFCSTTWNEMTMRQALGRGHRLTSLSETTQTILGFRGTVDIEVITSNAKKNKCLNVVTSYEDIEIKAEIKEVSGLLGEGDDEEVAVNEVWNQLEATV